MTEQAAPIMSIQRTSFYVLLTLVTISFVWLVLPYYTAILWAVILAIIFFPIHIRLERRLKGRKNLAAFLTVLLCVFLVIFPSMIVLASLIQEGTNLYQRLSNNEIDVNLYLNQIEQALPSSLEVWLDSLKLGGSAQLRERISSGIMQTGQSIAGSVLSFGQNTAHVFVSIGLMLYLLFFLFRDGASLASTIRQTTPLSDTYTRKFLDKFAEVARATVKGNVIIAIIQGTIGGLTFWMIGLEAALLWGVIMTLLSMLPAIGAALVWGPAALWMFLIGAWLKGTIIVVVGVLIIGLVDNLLRPPLVGKGTRLPDYIILISTLGGISLFGLSGFVIGPLIAALFVSAWSLFTQQQQDEGVKPQEGSHGQEKPASLP